MTTLIRSLLAVTVLCLGAAANADFVVVSEAYELALADLRLPGAANGTLTFRECAECEYQTVRVTSGTSYQANGQALSLEDFRKALEGAPNPSRVAVTVLHHLESDTIEAVQAWF